MTSRIRFRHWVFLFVLACAVNGARAADALVNEASTMVVETCAASLAGGKAQLITTALRRQAGRYIGNYKLKVFPYAFKNETGTISIGVSDELLRQLSQGKPVSFTGTAQTKDSGKTRPLSVIATPTASGFRKGKLTISIATDNGALEFAPEYALTGG